MNLLDSLNDFLKPEVNYKNVWQIFQKTLPEDLPLPAFFVETSGGGHHDGISKIDLVPFDRYGKTDRNLILYTFILLDHRFPGRLHYNVSPGGCHHLHLDVTKPISRRREITTGTNPCRVTVEAVSRADFANYSPPGTFRLVDRAVSINKPVKNDSGAIRTALKNVYDNTGILKKADWIPPALILLGSAILLSTPNWKAGKNR